MMNLEDINVCVVRIEGTNNEHATARGFQNLGVNAELVHFKSLIDHSDIAPERRRDLMDYQILMFPGGFSSGDYVRAGAIWASWLKSKLGKELGEFVREGRAVCGICNGFQVLTQLDLLPGTVKAFLATNASANFECRFVQLKHMRSTAFTEKIPKGENIELPIGHGEGRFTLSPGNEEKEYKQLLDNDQIVFKYSYGDDFANGKYPWNPNGAYQDIAGVCNLEGNVFGLMPHPERVLERFNHGQWTRSGKDINSPGDGQIMFQSVIDYIRGKF
jgi:phosphoribosylformylglycinamidine synthase